MAAAAGQLVAAEGIETAVGGKNHQLVGGFRVEHKLASVAFLVLQLGGIGDVALVGPNPAFFRGDDGDRLLLDHRVERHQHRRRRLADPGPPGAQGGVCRNPFLYFGDFSGNHFPPAILVAKKRAQAFAFLGQLGVLVADLLFFQLAELPQAHVEDRFGLHVGQLEGLHHLLFRLVLGADDVDDLVQVQVRDQKPFEHLEAVFDLFQAMLGTPDQDVHAVIEERLKRLA